MTPNASLFPPEKIGLISDKHQGLSLAFYHIMESFVRGMGAWGFLNVHRQKTRPQFKRDWDVWLKSATFDVVTKDVTEPDALIYDPEVGAFVHITPESFGRAVIFLGQASGIVISGVLSGDNLILTKRYGGEVKIDIGGLRKPDIEKGSLQGTSLVLRKYDNSQVTTDLLGLQDGRVASASVQGKELELNLTVGGTKRVDLSPLSDGYLKDVKLIGSDLEHTLSDNSDLRVSLGPMLDGVVTDMKLLGSTLQFVRSKGSVVSVDLSPLMGNIGGADGVVNAGIIAGDTLILTTTLGNDVQIPLSGLVDGVLTSAVLSNSNVLTLAKTKGSNVPVDLNPLIKDSYVDVTRSGANLIFTNGAGGTKVIDLFALCGCTGVTPTCGITAVAVAISGGATPDSSGAYAVGDVVELTATTTPSSSATMAWSFTPSGSGTMVSNAVYNVTIGAECTDISATVVADCPDTTGTVSSSATTVKAVCSTTPPPTGGCVIEPPTFEVTGGATPNAEGKYELGAVVEITVTPGASTDCDACTEDAGVEWGDLSGSIKSTDLVKEVTLSDQMCTDVTLRGKTTLCGETSAYSPLLAFSTICEWYGAPKITYSDGAFSGSDPYPKKGESDGSWYAGKIEVQEVQNPINSSARESAGEFTVFLPQETLDWYDVCGDQDTHTTLDFGSVGYVGIDQPLSVYAEGSPNIQSRKLINPRSSDLEDADGYYRIHMELYINSPGPGFCGRSVARLEFDVKWV